MIPNFAEFIGEGFMNKTLKRTRMGELRQEEGRKVTTAFGVEIVLHNYDFDYEELTREILDNGEDDALGVCLNNLGIYNSNEQKNLREGKCEYAFLLNDKRFVASFETYDELVEYGLLESDEVDEHDYREIIRNIVEGLNQCDIDHKREVGNVLVLMPESDVFDYECQMNEQTLDFYIDDFEDYFQGEYPDLELKTYSYYQAANIAIPVDYDGVLNYKKCKEMVEGFYKATIENQEEIEEEE